MWRGDDRPLVYVTFGTATADVPTATPIYGVAAVDPETLRDAIVGVLADESFRRAAQAIAAEIRGLPAADAALAVL